MRGGRRKRLEAYLKRLFGYAYSLTNDRDTSQDLVQECALKALTAKRVPRDEPAYRAWLFRILRNAFIDRIRHDKKLLQALETEPAENLVEYFSGEERFISVLTVKIEMAKLAPLHREIIALIDIAGFSYGEAADSLDVPVGTVMSRLSRARAALLKAIGTSNVQELPLRKKQDMR